MKIVSKDLIKEYDMDYIYKKSFSMGSCQNLCGKVVMISYSNGSKQFDCSCRDDCISKGNCCTDYHNCLKIYDDNQNNQKKCFNKIQQCDYCTELNGNVKCVQCSDNLYLRNGECLNSCLDNDKVLSYNKVCLPKEQCNVENCSKCDNTDYTCKLCESNYFLYKNQCLDICPKELVADRITRKCVEPGVESLYYNFPTKITCYGNCGKRKTQLMGECSCEKDCLRDGTCCSDIEEYCRNDLFLP